MNETDDALSKERELCREYLTGLKTKKEKDEVILHLIEAAPNAEQLREIGCAMIKAVLVNNPQLFRQLDDGKWILRRDN